MDEKAWIDRVWSKLIKKMPYALEKAQEVAYIPYTTRECRWLPGPVDGICWWTNGFWMAEMWQMYLATGDGRYKAEAERCEAMLDQAFVDYDSLHHDVGFLWNISSGVHFRLNGNSESRRRLLKAANILAGRFNPKGFIRAWNGECTGWAIIDCMMNLPLLFRAGEMTSDPRFMHIARIHADTTLRHFMRDDGSVHHIVIFDPTTGEPVEKPGGQGYAAGSSWSRGQAWALYGFVLAYIYIGERTYLDASKRVAHYFIASVKDDWLPACDFRAPKTPELKDSSAGAIAACGLLEISRVVPEPEQALYRDAAARLLRALDEHCADWSTGGDPAILQRCAGSYHNEKDHDMTTTYGDYFLIEAMSKLRGDDVLFW